MKKTIMIITGLLLMAVGVYASDDDTRQTLTVQDTEIAKTVSEIRFDENNAILLFSDGSKLAVDMQHVCLTLTYNDATGVGTLRVSGQDKDRLYDLQGRHVEREHLRNGVYILNGKKYYNKNK